MTRHATILFLGVLLVALPGCKIFNTALALAPTALLLLYAPEAVEEVPPADPDHPVPLDDALEWALASGASGPAYFVAAGAPAPAEAESPSQSVTTVCRLPVRETPLSPDLEQRMRAQGLDLVRVH